MSGKADNSILISIHGRRFGLNKGGVPLSDGHHVNTGGFKDRGVIARVYDHFLGNALQSDLWTVAKGSDGGCSNFAKVAQAGGYVKGITGADAGGTMALNGCQITGSKDFDPAFGSLLLCAAAQLHAITNVCFFIGLSDHTTLQMPFTIAAGVVTANDTDAAGFVFDTSATAATWKFCTVNNGGTPTLFDTGLAPVIDTDDLVTLDFTDSLGGVDAYLNGIIQTHVAAACDPGHVLTPKVAAFSRTAADINVLCDFISCEQSR